MAQATEHPVERPPGQPLADTLAAGAGERETITGL